jgi:hypothetical protein
MKDTKYLEDLILDYGKAFYGSKGPEYAAKKWVEALPNADLRHFYEWFDHGFWAPEVARALSDAGVYPREVTANTAYDLCCGELSVDLFLRTR